jgi:hypothetical protein
VPATPVSGLPVVAIDEGRRNEPRATGPSGLTLAIYSGASGCIGVAAGVAGADVLDVPPGWLRAGLILLSAAIFAGIAGLMAGPLLQVAAHGLKRPASARHVPGTVIDIEHLFKNRH